MINPSNCVLPRFFSPISPSARRRGPRTIFAAGLIATVIFTANSGAALPTTLTPPLNATEHHLAQALSTDNSPAGAAAPPPATEPTASTAADRAEVHASPTANAAESAAESAAHSTAITPQATAPAETVPASSAANTDEFIDPSAAQIALLPFQAPSLRDAQSGQQRLARHSQIVHSKVIAWLDLPFAQSTGFRPVTLDLFVPNNSVAGDATLPLLLVLHEGDPQHFHSQYNRHFANTAQLYADIAATGVTVAAINYRSPSETNLNGQVNDLRAAIRWLELNGSDYRLGQNYALWSFDSAGDIVQAFLLHQRQQQAQQQSAPTAQDSSLKTATMQLSKVALWHPRLLLPDLGDVHTLAINPQAPLELNPPNVQWLRYRHFDSVDTNDTAEQNDAATATERHKLDDVRLDALSRTLQFLFEKK